MTIDEALDAALDGDSILFVGAGFSRGAINIAGEQLLTGRDLANKLAKTAGLVDEELSLEDAAEAYLESHDIDELIFELRQDFTASSVTVAHEEIASLPWKRIYTTNYDDVFERARLNRRIPCRSISISHNIHDVPKNETLCIHFNGFISHIDRNNITNELKLTESSYLTAAIVDSPWAVLFRQDLRLASSVFFVGYSLYDLDIKRLVVQNRSGLGKTFFFLGRDPDLSTKRRAGMFGSALLETTDDLACRVKAQQKRHVPRESNFIRFLSLKRTALKPSVSPPKDREFTNLMLYGNYKSESIASSLSNKEVVFYASRYQLGYVLQEIEKGTRNFVIISELGNGKTLFLEGLRLRAAEKGYQVFQAKEQSEGLSRELEAVGQLPGKILLTIEEYQNWLDDIELFRSLCKNDAVLVVTARSAVHDVTGDYLADAIGDDHFQEMNLDILQELEWVAESFDMYGLWGEYAAKSRGTKLRLLRNQCGSQFHGILLKILESPDIRKRLGSLLESLDKQGAVYDALLGVLILRVLNFDASIDLLADVWGAEAFNSYQFRKNPQIQALISVSTNEITVRSPVTAEYLLKQLSDTGRILTVLISLARKMHDGRSVIRSYKNIFKAIMRFGSLQLILPEENRRQATLSYYESLRNLSGCRTHPLFWLQYAIAALYNNDLERAGRYFDTAYSYADSGSFDTFQIDNHYARYLLEYVITQAYSDSTFELFRQAKNIINRQIADERRHFPYRVALQYQGFWERHRSFLSSAESSEFLVAVQHIEARIHSLPDNRRSHRYVRECLNTMKYLIGTITV